MFDVMGTSIILVVMTSLFLLSGYILKNQTERKINDVTETFSAYALQVEERIDSTISGAVESVAEAFSQILEQPTVKKAFSILGNKSAEVRGPRAVMDKAALDLLDNQMAGLKIGASALGMDLDSYIEDHGAVATLQGLSQLGQMVGMDLTKISLGDLSQPAGTSSGDNPYLK